MLEMLSLAALKTVGTRLGMTLLTTFAGSYVWSNQGTILGLALVSGIASVLSQFQFSIYCGLTYKQAVITVLPFPACFAFIYFVFEMQEVKYIHPLIFIGLYIAFFSVSAMIIIYLFVTKAQSMDNVASKLAAARLVSGEEINAEESQKSTKSTKEILVLCFAIAAPIMFIFGMVLGYVLLIFKAFSWYEHTAWKVFITMVAQGVKIVGNKFMLKLMKGLAGKTDFWYADLLMYEYEYVTALLCRVLQLSIPDQNTAIMVSLFGGILEVMCRVFYLLMFLNDGMKKDGEWENEDEVYAYALRGKFRVGDAANDMMVEYHSSFTAAMFIIDLQGTEAFSFASDVIIPATTIYTLVAIQLIPELFFDAFVTFCEVYAGLSLVHGAHWDPMTGARKHHRNFVAREWGDLPKATLLKIPFSVVFVCISLAACVT